MRISVSHNKRKEDIVEIVDAALMDAMKAMPLTAIEVTDMQNSWSGPIMTFSLTAKAGFLKKKIHGTVEVTDTNVIVDADLGFLEKLLPEEKVRRAVQTNFGRLLT